MRTSDINACALACWLLSSRTSCPTFATEFVSSTNMFSEASFLTTALKQTRCEVEAALQFFAGNATPERIFSVITADDPVGFAAQDRSNAVKRWRAGHSRDQARPRPTAPTGHR